MVQEAAVLLRVQQLQQGRGGVALQGERKKPEYKKHCEEGRAFLCAREGHWVGDCEQELGPDGMRSGRAAGAGWEHGRARV